ncbi:MAG: hypothetical protein ACPKPY_01740 [Nitrososphaeraceae archaeon]
MIIDYIIRHNSGSLLVSGKRGTGKTSTIINSIREIQTNRSNLNINPIFINATNLDLQSNINNIKNNFLKELTRRLYYLCQKNKNFPTTIITEVYQKATAKSVKEEKKDLKQEKEIKNVIRDSSIKLDFNIINKFLILGIFCFLCGGFLSLMPIKELGVFNQLIPFLVFVIPYGIVSLRYGITKQIFKEDNKEILNTYYTNMIFLIWKQICLVYLIT